MLKNTFKRQRQLKQKLCLKMKCQQGNLVGKFRVEQRTVRQSFYLEWNLVEKLKYSWKEFLGEEASEQFPRAFGWKLPWMERTPLTYCLVQIRNQNLRQRKTKQSPLESGITAGDLRANPKFEIFVVFKFLKKTHKIFVWFTKILRYKMAKILKAFNLLI